MLKQDLRRLSQIEAPPERLDAVRARVLARIERRQRVLPAVWVAGSAATAALALLLWMPQAPDVETIEFAWTPPAPPGFAWVLPERKPEPIEAPAAKAEPEIEVVEWTESTDEQPGSTLLRLPSTDPNVLLYFIVEGKGD